MFMTIQSNVKDKILATPSETSKVENAPAEMLRDLDQQMEKRADDGKANVVTDALSRKERVKPRRVRAMAMTIQYGVRGMILAAQSEAFKQENALAERLHGSEMDEAHASRSPVLWAVIGESSFTGPELVLDTTDKVVLIKEKLKAARDRQKSYADKRRKPLEFEVGDRVLLKVSPWKGVELIEIMDREIRNLKRSKIALVKVHWNSKRGPEFTWEREDHKKSKLLGNAMTTAMAITGLDFFPLSRVKSLDLPSGDCDVEKNGKWSCIYAVGSQEYQVVCTRPDIASAGVDMSDGFDRGLQTNVQVFMDFDYAMSRSITVYGLMILGCAGSLKANLQHMEALSITEAGYMTFTEAWKKEIWLKGLLAESGYELSLVAGIATGALVKGGSRSEVPAQVEGAAYRNRVILFCLAIKVLDNKSSWCLGFFDVKNSSIGGFKTSWGSYKLGPGVETGVHRVQVDKGVWFEVELQGAQGDHEMLRGLYNNVQRVKSPNIWVLQTLLAKVRVFPDQFDATKGLLDKAKGNVLGMEIVRDQSGNTLRVSQSRFYNGKLVQTLLEGHSILSLEGSLSGDCDVEKNDVGMLDKFDHGLQTDVQVFVDFDYAMGRSITHMEAMSTTEAGYMTFTEAWKKEIWLKGLLT
ncbi:hypothetical protein Tco_0352717 [Tanacetum coccineum]